MKLLWPRALSAAPRFSTTYDRVRESVNTKGRTEPRPFNKYARLFSYADSMPLRSLGGKHPLFEHRQPLPHRAVHHRVANPHDQPAKNGRILRNVRDDALPKHPRKLTRQRILFRLGGLAGDGDVRVQTVFGLVDERLVFGRYGRNEHLTALLDHRVDVSQEKRWDPFPECLLHDLDLLRGSELRRRQETPQRFIIVHTGCDCVDKLSPLLDTPALLRQRQECLGVVTA